MFSTRYKIIPLVERRAVVTPNTEKTNGHKWGQTNTTKTTKRKQKVNKIPQSVKANEHGGETNN